MYLTGRGEKTGYLSFRLSPGEPLSIRHESPQLEPRPHQSLLEVITVVGMPNCYVHKNSIFRMERLKHCTSQVAMETAPEECCRVDYVYGREGRVMKYNDQSGSPANFHL